MSSKKALFLDRDGTLIVDEHYLNDPAKVSYLPLTFEALKLLKSNNYEFVIVTNQSGVARGLVSPEQLEQIHLKMKQDFAQHDLDFLDIISCTSAPNSEDPRRKPNPGMILEALENFQIARESSWMVGDKFSDVEAGRRAGVRSIFLSTGKESPPPGVPYYKNLMDAALHILRADSISN